jgi:hypothetical protein
MVKCIVFFWCPTSTYTKANQFDSTNEVTYEVLSRWRDGKPYGMTGAEAVTPVCYLLLWYLTG